MDSRKSTLSIIPLNETEGVKTITASSYKEHNKKVIYQYVASLKRGQKSKGGIYTSREGDFVIKEEDDPATCLLEGSACFAKDLIPKSLAKSVNFAHVGSCDVDGVEVAISIQPFLEEDYKPWSELITGEKSRDPHTIRSYESKNAEAILDSINKMTNHAKNELAMAIFISGLVGDESLHVGQFMAKNENGVITHITRIDFGARERFSVKRDEDGDYTHATSAAYKSSGQFGKDYISYLLAHPDIHTRVMHFWNQVNNDVINGLEKKYRKELKKQFDALPKSSQERAAHGVFVTIYKGAARFPEDEGLVKAMVGNMERRVAQLKKTASNNIKKEIEQVLAKLLLEDKQTSEKGSNKTTLDESKKNNIDVKQLKQLKQNIRSLILEDGDALETFDNVKNLLGLFTPSGEAIKLINHLQAKFQCLLYNDQSKARKFEKKLNQLKDIKLKYQMLHELENYRSHLNYCIGVESKIREVEKTINLFKQDLAKPSDERKNINDLLTNKFRDTISHLRPNILNIFFSSPTSDGQKLINRFDLYLRDYPPSQTKTISLDQNELDGKGKEKDRSYHQSVK